MLVKDPNGIDTQYYRAEVLRKFYNADLKGTKDEARVIIMVSLNSTCCPRFKPASFWPGVTFLIAALLHPLLSLSHNTVGALPRHRL